MGDALFNIDIVRNFMLSKSCKVKNHELVTHFKGFLNDPQSKNENRLKFKDFVNTLASIKIDESGEKVLVLKKKYREHSPTDAFHSSGKAINNNTESKDGAIHAPKVARLPGDKKADESQNLDSSSKLVGDLSSEIFSQISSSFGSTGLNDSKASSDASYMTSSGLGSSNGALINSPAVVTSQTKSKSTKQADSASTPVKPTRKKHEATDSSAPVTHTTPSVTLTQPASDDSVVTQHAHESPDRSLAPPESDAIDTSPVVDVKSRAKHLSKMTSESDIKHMLPSDSAGARPKTQKTRVNADEETIYGMELEEKEFLKESSKCNYQEMNKMLRNHPQLAKFRDFITGFTALHWAAKAGKADIIKLLCSLEAPLNVKSGYTPLHLAAIHGHEEIIELLVRVYGADPNIRDFSGRKPKHHLKNCASSTTQQLLLSRKLTSSSESKNRLSASSQGGKFQRVGSYSSKIQKSGFFGISGHVSMRSSWLGGLTRSRETSPNPTIVEDRKSMPPPQKMAPTRKSKNKKLARGESLSNSNPEINVVK